MKWWLTHGFAGFAVLTGIWGAMVIVYDAVIAIIYGYQDTISWQGQQASINNPIIPTMAGFIVWGLTIHFFLVYAWKWYQLGQPWQYWLIGGAAGLVVVGAAWTQRGV